MAGTILSQGPVASFQVGTSSVVPFQIDGKISEKNGNQLVRHRRPYRRGAKLDGTGELERVWTFRAMFSNRVFEPGLSTARAQYPFVLRELVAACRASVFETGTLVLPTVGSVRARCEGCERTDDGSAELDTGYLDLTFVEDNEESAATVAFRAPSVRATTVALSEQTRFSESRVGALDSDSISLTEAASEIEALLLAPGRSLADLQSKATANRRAIQRVTKAQESLARTLGLDHDEPRGSELWRQLARLQDLQARAAEEKFSSRPRVKAFVIDVDRTSLFEISARFKQDCGELLDLNSERVKDPFDLTRGQVIRVFETAPA
jgi:prophage DNA circulation protein